MLTCFSSGSSLGTSTSVENPLQITYFLCKTNPILSAVGGLQTNLKFCKQMDYENLSDWTIGENKPNSNPIKPNLRIATMNINSIITKDYRKYDDFAVRKNKANSNPISVRPKMNANVFITKDYRKKADFSVRINKPNFVKGPK